MKTFFPPIFPTPLEMMCSNLSVNMSSSDQMCTFSELLTMNIDPSESNPTCYEDYILEYSMCHILSFEIVQRTKGLVFVWPLGGFFLAFQLGSLEFGFSLLVMSSCLAKSGVGTLIHLSLTFSIR